MEIRSKKKPEMKGIKKAEMNGRQRQKLKEARQRQKWKETSKGLK